MKELFEQLLQDGEPVLEQMVINKEEETLHREFKTAADDRGTKLTREDKRTIAKVLSGFSNAEGGVLIIGIETATENNLDTAVNLRPIVHLDSYYNRVLSYVHDAISPQSPGIRVEAIRSKKEADVGYIAIFVPASDLRPHMSNADHRYFRRGSDGTRMMEHGEVRDLMLAPRQGRLKLRPLFESSGSLGGDTFLVKLFLALENIGRVPVSAPFIHIQGGSFQPAALDLISRSIANGIGIYARRDTLVHVEDTMKMGVVDVAFKMYDRDPYAKEVPEMEANYINSFADTQLFTIKVWNLSMAAHPWNKTDMMPSLNVKFGAENAPVQTLNASYSKMEWFRHLARAARLLTE